MHKCQASSGSCNWYKVSKQHNVETHSSILFINDLTDFYDVCLRAKVGIYTVLLRFVLHYVVSRELLRNLYVWNLYEPHWTQYVSDARPGAHYVYLIKFRCTCMQGRNQPPKNGFRPHWTVFASPQKALSNPKPALQFAFRTWITRESRTKSKSSITVLSGNPWDWSDKKANDVVCRAGTRSRSCVTKLWLQFRDDINFVFLFFFPESDLRG